MPRIHVSANMGAFLDMISFSEGTNIAGSDDGYDVLVGGTLFKGYDRHPGIVVDLPKLGIKSTAAGRYQILKRYAAHYQKQLGLKDFSPENQDRMAMQFIAEQKAYGLVRVGEITKAIHACKNIWASFPGAGYGQREHKLTNLLKFYLAAGGQLNDSL